MMNPRTETVGAHDREIVRLEGLIAAGHPLLRFPRDIESGFLGDFAAGYLEYRQRVLLITLFVVFAAGALDMLFVHAQIDQALVLRYGICGPLAILVVLFSRTRWFLQWQQQALVVFALILVGLLFGLMRLSDDHLVLVYSPGLMLVAVFAGMMLYLRFWLALCLLGAIGVAYVVFITHWRPQTTEIVVAYTTFYFTGSFMALFAGYRVEHTARRQYLQGLLLALKQSELELANRQLRELADQDGLTGIANRRYFDEQFVSEWNRALRGGYPLSVLLIDIDFFKHYNDTYGHQAGDDCLIVVASALRTHTQRAGDVAARYGGEEFAMILPATHCADAREIAVRLVRDIAGYRIPHRASHAADVVTVSAGVACVIPSPMSTPRELLMLADEALYCAKRSGRNRVEVAGDGADSKAADASA